jgi:glycosyltransferase involved in cell wall biosynthesis
MQAAADVERPLLIVMGALEPSAEAVGVLLEALDSDPMIGFAVPRLGNARGDGIARLDAGGDRHIDELPRRLLAEIPDTYNVADGPARCLLIKPAVLGNFRGLDGQFLTLDAALWHWVGQARRCGFRTLVCNRAVVASRSMERPQPPAALAFQRLPDVDRVRLRDALPDIDRAQAEFGTRQVSPIETRLARALPQAYAERPSLLLDVRNIVPGMNGTTMAALGIGRGLHTLGSGWDVALLASRDAARFHSLDSSFPEWPTYTRVPDRQFTVALRLSQPWHIDELLDLHALAAFNVHFFLDTIAWDIAYTAPRHLDGTWRFMADHADALMFDSDFTRQQLVRRFPAAATVRGLVCHYSFDLTEYVHPDISPRADDERFIFVVGNGYDHKDVTRTIDLLTRAFPYEKIVGLGSAAGSRPGVTVLESGTLSEHEVHRLYAGAAAVVFPSFYEGFGFPVLTTLAYGRPVLARRSALLEEIAACCPAGRGRLVPFDRREDLVELVGRLLHGRAVPEHPLGTGLDGKPAKSWRDSAAGMIQFLDDLTADVSRSRWRQRDHVARQLRAARAG